VASFYANGSWRDWTNCHSFFKPYLLKFCRSEVAPDLAVILTLPGFGHYYPQSQWKVVKKAAFSCAYDFPLSKKIGLSASGYQL
jgi:hypothetical protein